MEEHGKIDPIYGGKLTNGSLNLAESHSRQDLERIRWLASFDTCHFWLVGVESIGYRYFPG